MASARGRCDRRFVLLRYRDGENEGGAAGGRASAQISPPCICTMARAIDRPSPKRSLLVVKNESNSRSVCAGSMPGPVSSTAILTFSSSCVSVQTCKWRRFGGVVVHRVECVVDQIQQHLLHMQAVGGNARQAGLERALNRDFARAWRPGSTIDRTSAVSAFTSTRSRCSSCSRNRQSHALDKTIGAQIFLADVGEDVANGGQVGLLATQ